MFTLTIFFENPSRTGSLSLSATRQAQLLDMIRKNPEFLRGMRREVESVFDDKLEKRGVPKVHAGLDVTQIKWSPSWCIK